MAHLRGRSERQTEPLTERERDILTCMNDGFSNQEIANHLHLAEKTVRWYNSQIYSKLGVKSRDEAVKQGKALGLLDAPKAANSKHNLPAQATLFIGRQHELGEVAALLDDDKTRLVTILAPGGMGKTRLSLEAARMQIGRHTDGVIFVPLAPLSSSSSVVTAIAENIGFSFHGEKSPVQQLIDFLADRDLLLVLDNFEHLLDGAPLVADMVQSASNVKVLATSRERLNLQGETIYTLRGLEFPTWATPEDALAYDVVRLFMQSAQRIRPNFELQAHDLDDLARICRLTGGMPLEIELAAGWVDVLSLEQIAAEIQQGIDILETDARDIPERHRSVRATFERTWERLNEDEQRVFMRLSVFRGGFALPAAQAVAGTNNRHLRGLAQKALIQTERRERFAIHELLRQFGEDKLAASNELPLIQARHAAFFADFMAKRKQDTRTNRQLEVLELIDLDFENVRTAWLYVVGQQDWKQFPAFLHSLWFYCDARTRGQEALDLLEAAVTALQSVPASVETELALGRVLARLTWAHNDVGFAEKGAASGDEAIRILRQHDSPDDLIAACYNRVFSARSLNQADVVANVMQEGLRIARSIGDQHWEGHLLAGSARVSMLQGDFKQGTQLAKQGLMILKKLGDQGLNYVYAILGGAYMGQHQYEEAKRCLEQGLVIAERFHHTGTIAANHTYLADIALKERDYMTAQGHLRAALKAYWDTGHRWVAPWTIVYIAQAFADQHDEDKAVEILATIDPYLISLRNTDQMAHALRSELESQLESDRFAAAWARGQGRELSALVAELLAESGGE